MAIRSYKTTYSHINLLKNARKGDRSFLQTTLELQTVIQNSTIKISKNLFVVRKLGQVKKKMKGSRTKTKNNNLEVSKNQLMFLEQNLKPMGYQKIKPIKPKKNSRRLQGKNTY